MQLEQVFWLLLRERVDWTANFLPGTWAKLISRADLRKRKWFEHMASAAPACIDDLTELPDWLIREEDQRSLWELIPGDVTAALLVRKLVEASDPNREQVLDMLRGSLRENPPRLFGTCDRIKSGLKRGRIHIEALSQLIDTIRADCFAVRKAIEAKYDFHRRTSPLIGYRFGGNAA